MSVSVSDLYTSEGGPISPVDFHCHSTCSDGTEGPREVVREAAELGIRYLALTDHDTVAGVKEAHDEV
ncbi:hypothetical protein KIPB_015386 [Kipferlia bialata]|uniref:Polymerase/histidinol phosphatase N-terminal domain-containing protein n=1 Tax=Kipferlia bialata TaxID=797122 RepID=A0A9K3GRJ8_9EUKA|nr:hypothetical protein KIPB_015386 [Kipferlia bialata]|eukprot:g15386.t1